jgi:hypothetical protein
MLLLRGLLIFTVGEKMTSGKSNAALVLLSERSGPEAYNNVEDKIQTVVTVWDSNQ